MSYSCIMLNSGLRVCCYNTHLFFTESLKRRSKGWQRDTVITSGLTIPKVGWTTPDASPVIMKPRTSMSSRLAWPTVAPASASHARWGKTKRATSRTAVRLPTVTLTLSQRLWCAHVYSKKRERSQMTTANKQSKSLPVLYLAYGLIFTFLNFFIWQM